MNNSFKYTPDQLDILLLEIPEPKPTEDGFLNITDQLFKENVISKAYSYFMNQKRNSEVADIFLNSLLELIDEKSVTKKELSFQDFSVAIEETTASGKRIDIAIKDRDSRSCIIIENKVFHILNNDLKDYWAHFDCAAHHKVGVVLSLRAFPIDNENFINITHGEWMARIKSNRLPTGLSTKEYIYLTDFIQHMENLSKSTSMSDDVKFYFSHADKINRAKKVYEKAFAYVLSQLKIAAEKLDLQIYGWSEDHYRDLQRSDRLVYYSIVYSEVFTSNPEIKIILKIGGSAIHHSSEIKELIRPDLLSGGIEEGTEKKKGYVHLALHSYDLTPEDINRLSEYLVEVIERDFKILYDKVATIIPLNGLK